MATFETLYSDAIDIELGSNDSGVLFTTARRKHAINEGYRQFADLTECLLRQSTVAVSTGTQEYNLLSTAVIPGGDFDRMSGQGPVYHTLSSDGSLSQTVAGDDFPQRSVTWLDAADLGWRSTEAGTPTAWYLRPDGGQLLFGLSCPPDISSNETAKVILPYVPLVSSMTSTGDQPFTVSSQVRTDLQPYQQALVHYAAHDLEKLRKDQDASDRQLQKFLGYVQRYLQAARPKGGRSVRAQRSYFRDAQRGREELGNPRAPWWYR